MSCLPCGKVTDKEKLIVKYYKTLFDTTGKEYYVYRLFTGDGLKFVEKKYFNRIFIGQIKPNFSNGAEYFSIQEFKGN